MYTGRIKHLMRDGIGFVERNEIFGSDLMVVNATRVLVHNKSMQITGQDVKLLNYLAKHNHIGPFSYPQIQFRIKMPLFTTREWFRHTFGLSQIKINRQYIVSVPHYTNDDNKRDISIKQNSDEILVSSYTTPEIIGSNLRQLMYTEIIETTSLYAYFRICNLRIGLATQKEIGEYIQKIDQCLEFSFPYSWKALKDNI